MQPEITQTKEIDTDGDASSYHAFIGKLVKTVKMYQKVFYAIKSPLNIEYFQGKTSYIYLGA